MGKRGVTSKYLKKGEGVKPTGTGEDKLQKKLATWPSNNPVPRELHNLFLQIIQSGAEPGKSIPAGLTDKEREAFVIERNKWLDKVEEKGFMGISIMRSYMAGLRRGEIKEKSDLVAE